MALISQRVSWMSVAGRQFLFLELDFGIKNYSRWHQLAAFPCANNLT
jgi:hypothetical protein